MNTGKALIFNTAIALALSCGAAAGFAQSDQPSVADAARKARAEKKEPSKSAKVFTNDDIGDLTGTINVVGTEPTPATAAASAAASRAAATADGAKGETYFRNKFAAARRVLADDSKELDVLQREFNLKQTQFYSDPNVALREQHSRSDLNDTQAKIDAKKADVAKDQQAISDIEDDLRRSGGDSSWANAPEANAPETNSSEASAPAGNPPQASTPQGVPQQGAPQENTPQ